MRCSFISLEVTLGSEIDFFGVAPSLGKRLEDLFIFWYLELVVEGLGLGHFDDDTNNKSSKKKKTSDICFPQLLSGSLYNVGYLMTFMLLRTEKDIMLFTIPVKP